MNVKLLRWAIVALLGIGALAFIAVGANGPDDPTLRPAEGQVPLNRTPFGDFPEIGFRIEGGAPAQAAALRCALLAKTPAQQSRGLMNRTDIGGYDGMLFEFSSDTTTGFWMKDTPLPLSIVFFDGTGQFVSTVDMTPCIHQPTCPTYGAARPYRWALEVPQGALPRLGIVPGTRLVTAGPCS
ncbi:MAG TPA: DUF192 domain-containing protein [Acidimicrobiales bacterium]|nr:DUF192 domain-containing protein [Acidimicrobiales bacterium]